MNSELEIYKEQAPAPIDMIKELARRLEATYIAPKKPEDTIIGKEFETIVELALADGHNPLSRTFYYWKFRGKLAVTGAYTNLVNWSQKIEPFTITSEMLSIGSSKNKVNFHCRTWLLKRGDQTAYNERMKLVLGARQEGEPIVEFMKEATRFARELCFMGEGVVEWSEVFYPDGKTSEQVKGWVPGETRAQRRALKNAIRQAFGEPTPGERRALSLVALSEAKRYLAVPKIVADAGQSRTYLEIEDKIRESQEEIRKEAEETGKPEALVAHLRRQKNVEQMRGYDSIRDDILGPVEGEFTEEAPFDFTSRMDEIGASSKASKIVKGLFGKELHQLTDLEKWNAYQWTKRVQAMEPEEGSGLEFKDLVKLVPELEGYLGDKFVEAKNLLITIVKDKTNDGQKLQELSFEYEQ